MFGWDDLRVFLAASRAESLGVAGQRLGIDTATVGRRIARLETALKATLMIRSRKGLQLTSAGAQLARLAADAEAVMDAAQRVTHPDVASGTVRISASEGFGSAVLAPAIPSLTANRPGLRIELAATAGFLSPTRREVDMAITLSASPSPRLVVEPLTGYQLALYAAPDYLASAGRPGDVAALVGFSIVGYIDDLLYAPELRYLDELLPGLKPTHASSSIQAQRAIVAAGGGIGVLPCFLSAGLVRVLPKEVLIERRFWLNTRREVADTARLRSVSTWLRQLVGALRPVLSPF